MGNKHDYKPGTNLQRAPIANNGRQPAGALAQAQREPVHLPKKQIAPAAGRSGQVRRVLIPRSGRKK